MSAKVQTRPRSRSGKRCWLRVALRALWFCTQTMGDDGEVGFTASYSRPRVSNDNPFSEALFRTCKYHPNWPTKAFATKADAQAWAKSFVNWYNEEHLHSAIRFVTPNVRHDRATLENSASLYAKARAQ